MRPSFWVLSVALAVVAPSAALMVEDAKSVRIDGLRYDPAVLQVSTGESITWVNVDSCESVGYGEECPRHTATANVGTKPNSPTLDPGERYTTSFSDEGVFSYRCKFHPYIEGVVVVT